MITPSDSSTVVTGHRIGSLEQNQKDALKSSYLIFSLL